VERIPQAGYSGLIGWNFHHAALTVPTAPTATGTIHSPEYKAGAILVGVDPRADFTCGEFEVARCLWMTLFYPLNPLQRYKKPNL